MVIIIMTNDVGSVLYVVIISMAVLTIMSFLYAVYRPKGRRLLGYAVIALGVLFILALGRYQLCLALVGSHAEGVVVAVEAHRRSYRPVVRFVSTTGQEVVFRGTGISDRTYYAPGQQVTIRYLQSNPTFAEVESWLSLWRPLLIGMIFSGGVFVSGIVIVYHHCKIRYLLKNSG